MRPKTDDEILEDLKDWPVRNIYVERGVKLIEQLRQRVQELEKQRDELLAALENCRLLAARHRKEEWAGHVLRFCGESGVAGGVMR